MYTLLTVNSWENNIGLGDNLTFAHIVVSSSWSGTQSFGRGSQIDVGSTICCYIGNMVILTVVTN